MPSSLQISSQLTGNRAPPPNTSVEGHCGGSSGAGEDGEAEGEVDVDVEAEGEDKGKYEDEVDYDIEGVRW